MNWIRSRRLRCGAGSGSDRVDGARSLPLPAPYCYIYSGDFQDLVMIHNKGDCRNSPWSGQSGNSL